LKAQVRRSCHKHLRHDLPGLVMLVDGDTIEVWHVARIQAGCSNLHLRVAVWLPLESLLHLGDVRAIAEQRLKCRLHVLDNDVALRRIHLIELGESRVDGRPDTLARPNGKTTSDVALAFKSLLREEERKGVTGGLLYRKISCMPKIARADVVATFRLRAGHRPVRCP